MPRDVIFLEHNLYVGNHLECDAPSIPYARVLHIITPDDPEGCCECARKEILTGSPTRPGLILRLRDIVPLTTGSVGPAALREFFRGDDEVLIHCPTGNARASVVATLALVARGLPPDRAASMVWTCQFNGRGVPALLFPEPLGDVYRLAGKVPPWLPRPEPATV